MDAFEFATAGRVLFGAGRSAELPGLLAGYGSRVLVCTGASPYRHADLLAALSLPTVVFPVAGEPTVDLARAAVAAAREHGADVVAAIGGGSVIDTGKAAAMLLGERRRSAGLSGDNRRRPGGQPPFCSVRRGAHDRGNGRRGHRERGAASPEHQVKASLRGTAMLPRAALVEPLLTVSCPPEVTAASGMDALTQCLEPFVSPQASPLSDAMAREGSAGRRRGCAGPTPTAATSPPGPTWRWPAWRAGWRWPTRSSAPCTGWPGSSGAPSRYRTARPAPRCSPRSSRRTWRRCARPGRRITPPWPGTPRRRLCSPVNPRRPSRTVSPGCARRWHSSAIPGLGTFGLVPEQAGSIAAQALRSSSMRGNPVALTEDGLRAILARAA